MTKRLQIEESLFLDLLKWHLADLQDSDRGERIRSGLQAKLDAIVRRELFTASKTAATPEEREAARKAYLDAIGLSEDFRW